MTVQSGEWLEHVNHRGEVGGFNGYCILVIGIQFSSTLCLSDSSVGPLIWIHFPMATPQSPTELSPSRASAKQTKPSKSTNALGAGPSTRPSGTPEPAEPAPDAKAQPSTTKSFDSVRLAHLPASSRPRFDQWSESLFGDLDLDLGAGGSSATSGPTRSAAVKVGEPAPPSGSASTGLPVGGASSALDAMLDVQIAAETYFKGVKRNPLHLQIVPLILQFLQEMGWSESRKALEADSGISYRQYTFTHGSLLLQILQHAWRTRLTPPALPATGSLPEPAASETESPSQLVRMQLAARAMEPAAQAAVPLTCHVASLRGHTSSVISTLFLRDRTGRQWLATGSGDHSIRVWDPVSHQPFGTLLLHRAGVAQLALDPLFGRYLATGGMDGAVFILDTWQLLDVLGQDSGRPHTLNWLDQSTLPPGCAAVLRHNIRPRRFVVAVAWAPTSAHLGVATYDGTWRLFRTGLGAPGKPTGRVSHPKPTLILQETVKDTVAEALCFVDNGKTLLVSLRRQLQIWALDVAMAEAGQPQPTSTISVSDPPSSVLFPVTTLWPSHLLGMSVSVLHLTASATVACILASTDADLLLIWSWDSATKQLGIVGQLHGTQNDAHAFPRATWGPYGRYIYATGKDWTVVVWDMVGGKVVARIKHHRRAVRDLAVCADPYLLATASYDRTTSLWGPATGQIQA